MRFVPFSSTKDSFRLIYDAVWTVAHALHATISSGKWTNYSTDGSQISQNGDAILEQLKKVSFKIKRSPGGMFLRNKNSIQCFKLETCWIISGGINRNNRSHTV